MSTKANNSKSDNSGFLPGMQDYLSSQEGEEEFFYEGIKNERFFDASKLPDSPTYQKNADGAQTYILYLLFPSREELMRALRALTNNKRKTIALGKRTGSLNSIIDMGDGKTFLEYWEEKLLGIFKQKVKKKKVVDEDEAQAPI